MQPVPHKSAEKSEYKSDCACHKNERQRSGGLKWLNRINRPDHVRPEDEIDQRLRQLKRINKIQTRCQPPISAAKTIPTLVGLIIPN
jgi:hypothetical protein